MISDNQALTKNHEQFNGITLTRKWRGIKKDKDNINMILVSLSNSLRTNQLDRNHHTPLKGNSFIINAGGTQNFKVRVTHRS